MRALSRARDPRLTSTARKAPRRALFLALTASLLACGKAPRATYVPPPPVVVAKGPPPRFHWATRPPDQADLYVAVEGPCPNPSLWPVSHAMLFTYGVDPEGKRGSAPVSRLTTVARFTPDGLDDMTNGLGAVTSVSQIDGNFQAGLWLQEWGNAKGRPSGRIWRWRTGPDGRPGWELALSPEPEHAFRIPVRWAGGYVAIEELSDASSGVVNLALRSVELPPNVTPPDLIPPDFHLTDLVGFDTGELFAFGSRPSDRETIWSVRWVTPSDRTVTVHSFGASTGAAEMFATSPDDIAVRVGPDVFAFNGGSWEKGRGPASAWAPPSPEPGAKVVARAGRAWALSKGAVLRWSGSGWTNVTIPAPAFAPGAKFTAVDLAVSDDGEAFVSATYLQKGPSWSESVEFHAVLRSSRPFQTMRCNDPDPESAGVSAGLGVQSWPPAADETCPTPFVVLARRSNAHPQAPDYAPLRLPLRGHDEFEPLLMMDVLSGDRTYIGVPVKGVATARKLLQVETRALSLHGEIVCADPVPTRTMQIDLKSGAIMKEPAEPRESPKRRR